VSEDNDSGGAEDRIRAYKLLLSRVLEQRPSGTRQRLADALGKHRSFVTQITSATYSTPIPQKHLATIFSVCHFSPAEHESFMAAYQLAHPGRRSIGDPERKTRHLTLLVPDLGADNAAFDKAVSEFVQRMTSLIKKPND
jgi:hypothetical protein